MHSSQHRSDHARGIRLVRSSGAAAMLVAVAVALAGHGAPADRLVLAGDGGSFTDARASGTVIPAAPEPGAARSSSAFSIAGHVSGLFPGETLPLVLTVTNHESFPITVTSITTTVGNASAHCKAGNLTVTTFSGNLVVPAVKPRTATATVTVTMAHSAPNACQGARFLFRYSGLATEA